MHEDDIRDREKRGPNAPERRLEGIPKASFEPRKWLFLAAFCVLSGCTVGPDFLSPKADTPPGWTGTALTSKGASTPVPVEPSNVDWWQSFRDPELSSLIVRATAANLDLKEAALRISESRFQERITTASELPTVGANASYSTTRFSTRTAQGSLFGALGNIKGPPGFTPPSLPNPYDQFQTGFDASWEPDLFGGVKRSEEAAAADTDTAIEENHDALVSLEGEVARTYLDLRGTQLKLAITNENLQSQRETLALTRDRQKAQLGNDLDVSNATAQVTATQAQLPLLQREIDSDINQLGLLLAREPGALQAELKIAQAVPAVPPQVPVGLPGDLARRRPDIRAAEARLHAATARVGVAVADLYPKVKFDAPFGTQAERVPDLASWAAVFFAVGPTITIPIFEGGRLHATVHLQEAQEKEAAVDYAKTVLGAVHDVENALVTYSTEQQHRQALEATLIENRRALTLARQRYRDGITTFLDVLDAQRALLATQLSLADSTAVVSTDLVALYKALGGGWEIGEEKQAGK
jgi:NodT family efflux transporter outer membrane factor (OMF) lipoprotein